MVFRVFLERFLVFTPVSYWKTKNWFWGFEDLRKWGCQNTGIDGFWHLKPPLINDGGGFDGDWRMMFLRKAGVYTTCLMSWHPSRVRCDSLQVDDGILGVVNTCALRCVFDDIDEVGVIRLLDSGRKGFIAYAEEAINWGHEGGTDGAVRGCSEGFDVDYCFHIVRSLKLVVWSDSPARWAPPLRGGQAGARCLGVETPG